MLCTMLLHKHNTVVVVQRFIYDHGTQLLLYSMMLNGTQKIFWCQMIANDEKWREMSKKFFDLRWALMGTINL